MIQTKIQINAVQEIAMNRLWTEEEYKAGGKVVNIYFFFQPFLLTNTIILMVREDPFRLVPPLCGHCPNSNYTPPPHSNGHSGALFQARFYHFTIFTIIFTIFFTIFSELVPQTIRARV